MGLIDFSFVFLFPDDGGDAVVGFCFDCDFSSWWLWFSVVVTMAVVLVDVVVVEWVSSPICCGLFIRFFKFSVVVVSGGCACRFAKLYAFVHPNPFV